MTITRDKKSILFHVANDNIRSQKSVLKLCAKRIAEINLEYCGSNLLHFEYELAK
jgi:hypothetical protein